MIKGDTDGHEQSAKRRKGRWILLAVVSLLPLLWGSSINYPGAVPSGKLARVFAPGLISGEGTEFACAIAPEGNEIYFTRIPKGGRNPVIYVTKLAGGRWAEPEKAVFSDAYGDVDPMFSPGGQKLYFSSNRPRNGAGRARDDYDIWYVERSGQKWSDPRNPGPPINSDRDEFSPSLTRDGILYFASDRPGGLGGVDFYRAVSREGSEPRVENLGRSVNTEHREGDGFILQDETRFIFSAFIPGNDGSGDLYVSRRNADGTWTPGVSLGGAFNSPGNEFTPVISPDGDYFFFASDRSGNDQIYWMDARELPAGDGLNRPRLIICGGFAKRDIYSDVVMAGIGGEGEISPLEWESAPPLPVPLQGHAVIAAGGRLHIFGGLTGFSGQTAVYSGDVYSASFEKGGLSSWTKTESLPAPLGYHAAVKAGQWILVSGGFSSGGSPSDSADVLNYEINEDGKLGRFFIAGALLKPTRGHAAVVHGSRLFILGGHSDSGYFDDVYSATVESSGKLGAWEKTVSMPVRLVHFAAIVRGDFLYIFGGQDDKDALHDEIYAARISGAAISPWERAGMLPAPSSRMTVNVLGDTIIMTGGGFGWEEPIFKEVYAAKFGDDGKIGPWRKIGDLPKPMAFHAAVLWPDGTEQDKKRP